MTGREPGAGPDVGMGPAHATLAHEAERIVARAQAGQPGWGALQIRGLGWATVELDRAARELGPAVGGAPELHFEPAPDDPVLGARSRRARVGDRPWLVLLEPATEGRLAAFLARHGEGLAAVYAVGAATDSPVRPAAQLATGPLGRQRWLAGDRDGPWLILVSEDPNAGVEGDGRRGGGPGRP